MCIEITFVMLKVSGSLWTLQFPPPIKSDHHNIAGSGNKTSQSINFHILYTKPTDVHLYLHYNSYHQKYQKESIPFSQSPRIRLICTRINDFQFTQT